ncbi:MULTISPECIES: type IV pilus twitching motility protein PilT [unclassified Variovorax]|uniref:type IV pilus twitching motility protein PilT n=1 Tax=unclassified Variovorax TaxID=663243 RepID=UPI00076D0CF2|nr:MULTISPECIES: PilT/PilU family type 4a pilus ATPase [unclassified Variovorax]KWT98305.1 Twitching motility protein PilT [Variovorax sp. WDL1]PNG50040.1 Twitching mobility protein [Variovorax sp. B2]PNG50912.1 Twitching mobility protein [Variovorax sp. B4]VTU41562.1 Twitching mobility protein [Variovorax sp. SRS16]VTU41585.1 Twitching mobility protein [Variovorax sp. PBL-E5]
MLSELIQQAAAEPQVTDIILKEGDPMWVRLQGEVVRSESSKVTRDQMQTLLKKHQQHIGVPAENIQSVLEEKAGDLDFAIKVGQFRFRCNLYLTNGRRLAVAMRRLPDKAPPLAQLGLPDGYMKRLLTQSKGLLLVTGATGSGKTTTLASTVDFLNESKSAHIITLEDPVEYLLTSESCLVDQRQIGRDTNSFSNGLRAALREDPDILLIGELRDFETIKTALAAATTGHLVLGSLHTNSARQSVERLTSEFGAERRDWAHMVLSQALLGCVTQTLVPRADGKGRVLAAELMICTPDIKTAIRDGKTSAIFNHMDTGSSFGQVLLNTTLRNFVRSGVITADEALYASYDPANLRKELGLA